MRLYLIDASIYIFRAWFSLPQQLIDAENRPINAAYGFTKFLTEFLEAASSNRLVVAFDESLTHSFRNDIYPAYKMNRELPPEELKQQFSLCKDIVTSLGIKAVAHNQYEADDLIGTLAVAAKARNERVTVVSADKDLAQLLGEGDYLWDFARKQRYDLNGINEKFGVKPHQITDYLGLCGDAVDNIPGVPSIGPKKAVQLLSTFGNMDAIYDNLEKVSAMEMRGAKSVADKLSQYKQQAYLSKQLATIFDTAPIDTSAGFPELGEIDAVSVQSIVTRLGGRGEGLIQRMINSLSQPN